jgi:hypothetical protein
VLHELRMNDLPHNRVSQIFFALEVMKQCAFGRACFINDAIKTTALKSVFVKFVESSLEDFSSRVFWRSGGGRSHSLPNIQTSRYVSMFKILIIARRKNPLHDESTQIASRMFSFSPDIIHQCPAVSLYVSVELKNSEIGLTVSQQHLIQSQLSKRQPAFHQMRLSRGRECRSVSLARLTRFA